MEDNNCRLCGSSTSYMFHRTVLYKHLVSYWQCNYCDCVQTEKPYWLEEAYVPEHEKYDTGQVFRSISNSAFVFALSEILKFSDKNFLDYGCGSGLLVRLLRDVGLSAFGYDQYSTPRLSIAHHKNVFTGDDFINISEVVEHFENPSIDFEKIFLTNPKVLLISTTLYNNDGIDWYYFAPQHGQHIFFYTRKSVEWLANKYGYKVIFIDSYILILLPELVEKIISSTKKTLTVKAKSTLNDCYNTFLSKFISSAYHFPTLDNQYLSSKNNLDLNKKTIVIDGFIFQYAPVGGIARVWGAIISEFINLGFTDFIVLDRGGTFPKIDAVTSITIPLFDFSEVENDITMLQNICEGVNASLFISTYYTIPKTTPSLFYLYDMIPEVFSWDLNEPIWQLKGEAIKHASKFVSISQISSEDLHKFYPSINLSNINLCHIGVYEVNITKQDIASFKEKYNITKPYFILITPRRDYKNAQLFFSAFEQLGDERSKYGIFCTVGVDDDIVSMSGDAEINSGHLSEIELWAAYSGAIALVYPSLYEGFGLPIIEAMACSCPVIACKTSSIPEVAGEFAIYVRPDSPEDMKKALLQIINNEDDISMIERAKEHAKKFTWQTTANKLLAVINKGS